MKLSDTALVVLSAAAQRPDRGIELTAKLKGAAATKLIDRLQAGGLVETVRARGSLPVWRRDEEDRPLALRVTRAGLKAIRIDDGGEDIPVETASIASDAVKPSPGAPRKPRASRQDLAPPTSSPSPRLERKDSKQAQVLAMLRRDRGTTVAAIMEATGWQPHSVRGFLAGAVRKRIGLTLVSEVVDDIRLYRIPSDTAGKKAPSANRRAAA